MPDRLASLIPWRPTWGGGLGVAPAVADQVIVSGLNFAFILVVGRQLNPSQFGAFAIVGATLMLGMLVHGSLVISPMTLEASSVSRVLRDSMMLHVVITVGLSALMVAVSYLVPTISLVAPIRLTAAIVPFVLTGEFFRRVEMARVNWPVVVWSDSLGLGLRLAALMALGGTVSLELGTAALLYAVGAVVSTAVLLYMDRRILPRAITALSARGRISRRQGSLLLAGQLASWGNSQALMYTVGASAGLAQIGALSASQVLLQPLNILLLGAGNWSLPHMARLRGLKNEQESFREILKRSSALSLALGGIALAYGLVLLPFASRILNLLYTGKYADVIGYVALWVVAYTLSAAARGLSIGITALRRADVVAAASLCGLPLIAVLALSNTGLGASVVPIGSAIGSVAQLCVMLTFLVVANRRSSV